ncbi:hypothetical protein U0070_002667 [Myodes glareolus]|uniref:Uncharacterized protein n=1 Tax=Myodes glareolus TaxID=447135 RepID=A0AAW0H1D3_MYOGA
MNRLLQVLVQKTWTAAAKGQWKNSASETSSARPPRSERSSAEYNRSAIHQRSEQGKKPKPEQEKTQSQS